MTNRFLFYATTQYTEELEIEAYRPFVQHWLTSKMWSPNKLLQKYYIIITNALMELLSRVKGSEQMRSSSFSPLHGFDLLAKFCSSLVLNTVISDEPSEIAPGRREEEAIANVVLYELFRNYADRIYRPADRRAFATKAVDIFQREFHVKGIQPESVDRLVLGNFHKPEVAAYFKYVDYTDKEHSVRDGIVQKIADKSNNHFLASILEAPGSVRDVFRLSRILFKEQQHLILCGSPSSAKYESLQIAAMVNGVVMLELNVAKYNEPTKFAHAFKQALLTVARLDDTNCYLVINDAQLRDPVYIDYAYNYIANIGKDEDCILMDEEFKEAITEVEVELFRKNKENFKYDRHKQPNLAQCLKKGVSKLMSKVHIVFMIGELQTYYEWISLFPGLETRCDVLFLDDLVRGGYKELTDSFLAKEKTGLDAGDAAGEDREGLVASLVYAKDAVNGKIFSTFYPAGSAGRHAVDEFYNGRGIETVYADDRRAHAHLFEDGSFDVYDPLLKQVNYNVRAELNLVMKSRYIMYLEVYRFLYDFLALNLTIRAEYYDAFRSKTEQFREFFADINAKKKVLHGASNKINYKMHQK